MARILGSAGLILISAAAAMLVSLGAACFYLGVLEGGGKANSQGFSSMARPIQSIRRLMVLPATNSAKAPAALPLVTFNSTSQSAQDAAPVNRRTDCAEAGL